MRHRNKHKTVFLRSLWLEKIRINRTYVTRYSRVDQVKFVEDSLLKKSSEFDFFCCNILPQ